MFLSKKNIKESLIVIFTYSKITYAEITKNYLIEEVLLNKILKKEKSKFIANDFTYMTFVNDHNKIFRVVFQLDVKKINKKIHDNLNKLAEQVFECKDVFAVDKNQIADLSEFCSQYEIKYSDISAYFSKETKNKNEGFNASTIKQVEPPKTSTWFKPNHEEQQPITKQPTTDELVAQIESLGNENKNEQ